MRSPAALGGAAVARRGAASAGTCDQRLRFRGACRAAGDHRACDLQSRRADPAPYRTIASSPGPTTATSPASAGARCLHGSVREAAAIVGDNGVGLVALCRGNDETGSLPQWAPAGLHAALAARQQCRAGWNAMPRQRRRAARNLSRLASSADRALHGITVRNAARVRGFRRRIRCRKIYFTRYVS